MIVLAIGLAIWAAVHFLPSISPSFREQLIDNIGAKAYRGAFALSLVVGLALIVVGYRSADWIGVYDPPAWGVHANNTLMLLSVYLMGVGGAKGWLASKIRHPMLLGVTTWSVAHLLANGDEASVLLFGGMLLWALGMIFAINRRVGAWAPPKPCGAVGEIKLIVITLLIFGVIALSHGWLLGVNPFPV